MKSVIILISFICSFVLTAQSIFPTHRFVDWKIAGSEQWDESGFLLINMQDYAIDALGNQANDVLLDSIVFANIGQSIRIHFPVGTFLFNESIQLRSNVILEGEGANQTHFVFQLGGAGSAIQSNGQALTSFNSLFQQTALKNSNSIILNSNHGFVAGDWIRISQVDSDLVYSSWAIGLLDKLFRLIK